MFICPLNRISLWFLTLIPVLFGVGDASGQIDDTRQVSDIALETLGLGTEKPQGLGPTLVLQDSVILQEHSDTYVADPLGFFIGPDSSFYIMDGFVHQVIRFSKTGELIGTYGRQGEGPGEFGYIGDVGFAYANVMGVADWRPARLVLFEPISGKHLGNIRLSDLAYHHVRPDANRLWVTGIEEIESVGWRAVGSVTHSGLPGGDGQTVSHVSSDRVLVPRPYIESAAIRGSAGAAIVAPGRDNLWIAFSASPFVLRASHDGEVLDTILLIPNKRRGVPADDEFIRVMDPSNHEDMKTYIQASFSTASLLVDLSRGRDDYLYAVHFDPEWRDDAPPAGPRFVSTVKVDGSESCADTVVPTIDDGRTALRLRGHELFVLDQRIVDDADHVRTVVRRFAVDPTMCTGVVETSVARGLGGS